MYWEVVSGLGAVPQAEDAQSKLTQCVALNPFLAEPHVLLAQLYIHDKQWPKVELE